MYDCIIKLIQMRTCIQGKDEIPLTHVSTLINQLTVHGTTEALPAPEDTSIRFILSASYSPARHHAVSYALAAREYQFQCR